MSEPTAGPFRTTSSLTPSFQGSLVGCLWWECGVVMHWMTMSKHVSLSLWDAPSERPLKSLTGSLGLSGWVETAWQAGKLESWEVKLEKNGGKCSRTCCDSHIFLALQRRQRSEGSSVKIFNIGNTRKQERHKTNDLMWPGVIWQDV